MPRAPFPTDDDVARAIQELALTRRGDAVRTPSSLTMPVDFRDQAAFLKVTNEPEELLGATALEYWDGVGAVRVLARFENAVVLERLGGTLRSLVTDDASQTLVLCDVAARIHEHPPGEVPRFPSMPTWFASLFADSTPLLDRARGIAETLVDQPGPVVLLHGDLHHENVLDGGGRGWLAIDPHAIVGPREFDYCNIFTNWTLDEATANFDSRLEIVTRVAGIERTRLLRWIAAWAALSGVWHLEDGDDDDAAFPHAIMELALHRLDALHE